MSGEKLIGAPKDKVWEALNDPAILQACIPGCESFEKISDIEISATAAVTLGPISTRISGKVLLSDLDPPHGYTMSGEGQGGVAGFAKGGAKVKLLDESGGTKLAYQVNAQVSGKMAQINAGLIDSTAKQYAESFFTKFAKIVTPLPEVALSAAAGVDPPVYFHLAHEDHDHDPSNPHYFGLPIGVIIAAGVAAVAVGLILLKFFVEV
jgi:carbon monoxide dehydrogenase subunit G